MQIRSVNLATITLALCAVAAPQAVLADVKAGVEAWERGDYPTAVTAWRTEAVKGDADAQFNLGQAYKLGRGVPTDLAQAESWYRRAATQGHLQAEDNLGLVLFTLNRREEAMRFIGRSASRGEPRAQYVLGTAHFNGDLADRNWARAYALTKRASDAGLGIASARLAQLDRMIPLEDRQMGMAMLPELERDEQRARLAAATASMAAAPPPPSAVRPAPIAPSLPAATYVPPPMLDAPAPPLPAPAMAMGSAEPLPELPPAPTISRKDQARAAKAAKRAAAAAAKRDRPARGGQMAALPPMIGSGVAVPAPPAPMNFPAPAPVPPQAVPAATLPPLRPIAAPGPLASAELPASTPGTSFAPPPMAGAADAVPEEPAAAPAPTATTRDGWRVQLGAFSDEARARALWAALEKRFASIGSAQPYLVKAGPVTRLQAGDFAARADAAAFCAPIASSSQPCVVVKR